MIRGPFILTGSYLYYSVYARNGILFFGESEFRLVALNSYEGSGKLERCDWTAQGKTTRSADIIC